MLNYIQLATLGYRTRCVHELQYKNEERVEAKKHPAVQKKKRMSRPERGLSTHDRPECVWGRGLN